MTSHWWVRLVGAALLFIASEAVAVSVPPDNYIYEILFDTDSNDATGCSVDAEDENFTGPVPGIEYVLATYVARFPDSAEIDAVVLFKCEGGMLVHDQDISPGNWPAGLENGINGADIVETKVPRAAIGDPASMVLGAHSTRVNFNDVLLTKDGSTDGEQIVFVPGARESVPALSWFGLGLTSLLLLVVAWISLRSFKRGRPVVAMTLLVASLAATAWAATIVLDGNVGDWSGIPPIATDQLDDSTADDDGEDFVAMFATSDATNLYFRLDVVNLAPVVCGDGKIDAGEDCEGPMDCNMDEECNNCDCEPDDK
jgi:hypothetical protein